MRTTVQNLTSTKGNKVANQFRIDIYVNTNHLITFQSYYSEILTIDTDNCIIRVGVDFGYSRTTAKYTKIFLQDVFDDSFGVLVNEAIKNHLDIIDIWRIEYDK